MDISEIIREVSILQIPKYKNAIGRKTAAEIVNFVFDEIKNNNMIVHKDMYFAMKQKCHMFDEEHPNTWGRE